MRRHLALVLLAGLAILAGTGCTGGGGGGNDQFELSGTSPNDNATSVGLTATVRFTFSRAANPASLTYTCTPNATLTPAWSSGNTQLSLSPSDPFTAATAYTITITALTDATGVALPDTPAIHFTTSVGAGDVSTRVFFLHHSVGAGIIGGGVRDWVGTYNTAHATTFEFWDHGYMGDGLTDGSGTGTGTNYGSPTDDTEPSGLLALWTSSGADYVSARQEILDNYGVIAFKSCFTATQSVDAQTLADYQAAYLAMRNVFDAHTERIFVVVTPPPNAYGSTDAASASNARAFANWLGSGTYLTGHPNVRCFDLFTLLANPDNGTARANMLRDAYLGDATGQDSHPNDVGYGAVAPVFAEFLIDTAVGG